MSVLFGIEGESSRLSWIIISNEYYRNRRNDLIFFINYNIFTIFILRTMKAVYIEELIRKST